MTDLFSALPPQPDRTVGRSNGEALGHIANGASRARMRDLVKGGSLPGVNLKLIADNLDFQRRA